MQVSVINIYVFQSLDYEIPLIDPTGFQCIVSGFGKLGVLYLFALATIPLKQWNGRQRLISETKNLMDMDLSNKGILFTLVLAENNERDVASGDWPGTMSAGLDL